MAFPVKTLTSWDVVPENTDFINERTAWVDNAISSNKTDQQNGTAVEGQPGTFSRNWVDATAAQEWKDFITALGVKYGFTATVTIV